MSEEIRQSSVFLIILFLAIMLGGCASTNQIPLNGKTAEPPRLVRISFVGEHNSFRVRVDQEATQKFRNSDYTNIIAQLNLGYGDIVVWEDQRNDSGRELSHPKDVSDWWFKYLKQNQASFYSIPQRKDFFSTQLFHWVAPYEPPRPLAEAKFFLNGELLGTGANGFRNMTKRIESIPSGAVPIFAPRIKNRGQASPWIAEDQLRAWSQDAGVAEEFEKMVFDRLAEYLDFARFMDDD